MLSKVMSIEVFYNVIVLLRLTTIIILNIPLKVFCIFFTVQNSPICAHQCHYIDLPQSHTRKTCYYVSHCHLATVRMKITQYSN